MKISANTRYNPAKTNSFGYNYETHRVITRTALKQIPDFEAAVREAAEGFPLRRDARYGWRKPL